jgi:hypothetical protein
MTRAPVLLEGRAADPDPDADDSGENQDHADENDEVCGMLAQRKAGVSPLVDVGDKVVLDEIEQQAERRDRDPEPGQARKRRSNWERRRLGRRDWNWIDQLAYLRNSSLLLTFAIISQTSEGRQVFDQQRHAIE